MFSEGNNRFWEKNYSLLTNLGRISWNSLKIVEIVVNWSSASASSAIIRHDYTLRSLTNERQMTCFFQNEVNPYTPMETLLNVVVIVVIVKYE